MRFKVPFALTLMASLGHLYSNALPASCVVCRRAERNAWVMSDHWTSPGVHRPSPRTQPQGSLW